MGFYGSGKAEDGGPLAVAGGLPDDVAVEEGGDGGGGEIAVEVEEFCVGLVLRAAEVEMAGGWGPLGGEDQRGVVGAGVLGRLLDLGEGEVVEGNGFDGEPGVEEVGVFEFRGGGPRGEDGSTGVAGGDEVDGLLVEEDHVAIGEVVLRREGVGRVDEEGGEEGGGCEDGECGPDAEAVAPEGDADEQDERVQREEVAGEQGAAEDRKGEGVAEDDDEEGGEDGASEGFGAGAGRQAGSEEGGEGADRRDPEIHVDGEVDEAVVEAEEDAKRGEVGGGVVAEELGIAEDEAGLVAVVGVPGNERQKWGEEGDGPDNAGGGFVGSGRPGSGQEEGQLPKSEDDGGDDCGLLGEGCQGEEKSYECGVGRDD